MWRKEIFIVLLQSETNKTVTMKKFILQALLLLAPLVAGASELTDKMATIAAVKQVTPMENSAGFEEKYEVMFQHPVDYKDSTAGNFTQRIFVCHRGFDRPTIVVTEGYWATYAERPAYREELSRYLDANIIVCEYRYFAKSVPEKKDWTYLTVFNSLNDLHQVVEAFKTIYPKKWLATGISKGGQTSMFYRAYFPDDVDVTVPYVAPLNKSLEDGRHEPFIANKPGTAEQREEVRNFQLYLLQHKADLMPYFKTLCYNRGFKFNVSLEDIYDYWVLEYSFAYWQWYSEKSQVPDVTKKSYQELCEEMFVFNEPSYFESNSAFLSFNVQAIKELGYYGYDLKPFKQYTSVKNTHDYMRRIMVPEELSGLKFDKSLYKHTVSFLKKNDPRMVYIYGEFDPWSATGVCTWLDDSKKENLKIYVQPSGSHLARIGNMPEDMKEEILAKIKAWME